MGAGAEARTLDSNDSLSAKLESSYVGILGTPERWYVGFKLRQLGFSWEKSGVSPFRVTHRAIHCSLGSHVELPRLTQTDVGQPVLAKAPALLAWIPGDGAHLCGGSWAFDVSHLCLKSFST